jgi:hypothetical protein
MSSDKRPGQTRAAKTAAAGGQRKTPVPARPPRRYSFSLVGFGVIGVVVVIIVALVIVKVTGGSPTPKNTLPAPTDVPAPASLIAEVTSVPSSVAQAVGLPSSVNPPTVLTGQSLLVLDGKPGALFIGAEFCPYCAAERWAVVMAFSKFGTFSDLKETTSSPWDYAPSTATFSFYGASYLSNLITLETVEAMGNDTTGLDTHRLLQAPTSAQSNLWATYSQRFGVPEGFPFLDVGNRVFTAGPSYDPKILSGLTQSAIAAKLANPRDPVTRAIVGSANYLTAAICSITDQQPASVCSAAGTAAAAKALGTG